MSRSRSYVFTFNNYSEADEVSVRAIDCSFLVYGREKGESGTPHLQGFVYFSNARRFDSVRKMLLGAHVEVCRDVAAAIQYCRKDGDVFEKGNPPLTPVQKGDKEKKRYQRAWDLAKAGDIEEIDADILLRHYNTIKKIKSDYQQQPQSQSELSFYWYYRTYRDWET